MRWLKRTISTLMLLTAAGIALAIAFSNHSDDYGRVALPQGGTVHLPKGKVIVFDRLNASTSDLDQASAAIRFQVEPVGGGQPVGINLDNGQPSEFQVERSETIGELGAIGKLDVPAAGDYLVSGSSELPPGTASLDFGTNAGSALLNHWKLLAGLLLGAALLAFIPVPRSGRRRGHADEPHWSSDPRAPYSGLEPAHPAAAPAERYGDRRR
jgi:hypothetical protein